MHKQRGRIVEYPKRAINVAATGQADVTQEVRALLADVAQGGVPAACATALRLDGNGRVRLPCPDRCAPTCAFADGGSHGTHLGARSDARAWRTGDIRLAGFFPVEVVDRGIRGACKTARPTLALVHRVAASVV
jgi:hypothetical protein